MSKKLLTWKEMPIGGMIVDAGNSEEYETGGWRTYRPVRAEERCIHCLRCWILCPDSAILVEDGKMIGFDYDHVLRLDGKPMYEGHEPPCLYPEEEMAKELQQGVQGVLDAISEVQAKRQAELVVATTPEIPTEGDEEDWNLDEIEVQLKDI